MSTHDVVFKINNQDKIRKITKKISDIFQKENLNFVESADVISTLYARFIGNVNNYDETYYEKETLIQTLRILCEERVLMDLHEKEENAENTDSNIQ